MALPPPTNEASRSPWTNSLPRSTGSVAFGFLQTGYEVGEGWRLRALPAGGCAVVEARPRFAGHRARPARGRPTRARRRGPCAETVGSATCKARRRLETHSGHAGGCAVVDARRYSPAEYTAYGKTPGARRRAGCWRAQGAAAATPSATGVTPTALALTWLWKWEGTWPPPYKRRPLGSIGGSGPRRVGGCAFGDGTGARSSAEACDRQWASRGSLTSMR